MTNEIGRTPDASRGSETLGGREAFGVRASSAPLSQGRLRFGGWAGPRRASIRVSSSSLAAQCVGLTQTHRLNCRQNSRDETLCDRKRPADDQVASRNKKNREKLPDKTRLRQPRHHQPAEQQTEDPAEDSDDQRFTQNDAEYEFVAKAHRLKQPQFLRPLAHRLRHGVAGNEQDGEKDSTEYGCDDHRDVADLLRETFE